MLSPLSFKSPAQISVQISCHVKCPAHVTSGYHTEEESSRPFAPGLGNLRAPGWRPVPSIPRWRPLSSPSSQWQFAYVWVCVCVCLPPCVCICRLLLWAFMLCLKEGVMASSLGRYPRYPRGKKGLVFAGLAGLSSKNQLANWSPAKDSLSPASVLPILARS